MTYTPDTPLEALAGIGPKKAQAFQKLGVATLRVSHHLTLQNIISFK